MITILKEGTPNTEEARLKALETQLLNSYLAQAELYERCLELEAQNRAVSSENISLALAVADLYETMIGGVA